MAGLGTHPDRVLLDVRQGRVRGAGHVPPQPARVGDVKSPPNLTSVDPFTVGFSATGPIFGNDLAS
jgi:hypothetical protein